jgi:hypothetical protein
MRSREKKMKEFLSQSNELRKKDCKNVQQKYPNRIPVITLPLQGSVLKPLEKFKFLIPDTFSGAEFISVLRSKMLLNENVGVFYFVRGNNKQMEIFPVSRLMTQIYQSYHNKDDLFLYIYYDSENVFGGKNIRLLQLADLYEQKWVTVCQVRDDALLSRRIPTLYSMDNVSYEFLFLPTGRILEYSSAWCCLSWTKKAMDIRTKLPTSSRSMFFVEGTNALGQTIELQVIPCGSGFHYIAWSDRDNIICYINSNAATADGETSSEMHVR